MAKSTNPSLIKLSLILKYLGIQEISSEDTLHTVYGDIRPSEASEKLQRWLLLLPNIIRAQIEAALRQERPFLPPYITPEMMAAKNNIVPSMTQMDILYRCVGLAVEAEDFNMAACLVYVVDRATYWSGASKSLLQVVELIKEADPLVAIAPQVQVREARVLKDEGDMHGAMKVLSNILERRQGLEGEWKYVDEDQYVTTKAEIIKIKGHILYNMGMFKESVEPFLESIDLFSSLQEKDDKGIASCLGLLTKCLGRLSLEEFNEIRQKFPEHFENGHPCFESYVQGVKAIKHIESLQESLYSSRHMLDADTSLLKYAILSPSLAETYELLQTILKEMKSSLGAHKTIDALESSEQFFEFVRALFMISLVLAFSPVQQDRMAAEYIQQLSIELYLHLCNYNKVQRSARLNHSSKSFQLINTSLTVLGLPALLGVLGEETSDTEIKIPEAENKELQETEVSNGKKQETNLNEEKTFRGWTYNFGHETREEDNVDLNRKYARTFPLANPGKPLDPKKQWQTYKHKCVGLPVDPDFFSSPAPSYERSQLENEKVASANKGNEDSFQLVNLSVPYIKQTVENRSNPARYNNLVDRQKTTASSIGSMKSAERSPLHPHDLPNQPMKLQHDNDTKKETREVDATKFAPLVDLAKTTMSDVLEANVGESVSTYDTVDYINGWHPSNEGLGKGKGVRRAFLLNFNPITSVWTSQSTLAFLGDELGLTEDKKGNCRNAFHVQFLHQDEPRGRYVGKRYRNLRHHNPARYMQDVVCQMMAGYYVTRFNEAMQNYKRDIQVQFLPAAHLQLLTPYGDLEDCLNVEPYLQGEFIKLTNNLSWADMNHQGKDLATALSHFSYCESKGTLMIVDIQGWLPREGTGVVYLTDPQFHTIGMEKFSPYDHQDEGMKKFWENVHPHCNDICKAIGLERSQQ